MRSNTKNEKFKAALQPGCQGQAITLPQTELFETVLSTFQGSDPKIHRDCPSLLAAKNVLSRVVPVPSIYSPGL